MKRTILLFSALFPEVVKVSATYFAYKCQNFVLNLKADIEDSIISGEWVSWTIILLLLILCIVVTFRGDDEEADSGAEKDEYDAIED